MRSATRRPAAPSIVRLAVVFATFASLAGLLTAAPASAAPSPMPARVVVAPSGAVDSLNGLSIADDGSGGMVFLETVAGVPHVFVSRLEHGAWQPPEQADVGLSAASSQPQIAAHNHGELVVAFVNSGALYVNTVRYRKQLFSTPQELATGASNPTVSICTGMVNVAVCPAPSVAIVNLVGAAAVIESGRKRVTFVPLTGVASSFVTLAVRSNSWLTFT